jgi:hypothetical protein
MGPEVTGDEQLQPPLEPDGEAWPEPDPEPRGDDLWPAGFEPDDPDLDEWPGEGGVWPPYEC